jgi:hypothetical protein
LYAGTPPTEGALITGLTADTIAPVKYVSPVGIFVVIVGPRELVPTLNEYAVETEG